MKKNKIYCRIKETTNENEVYPLQKSQLLFISGLILAILVTIFAITNANPVVLNLFFYQFSASQALIIFVSAALGAIIVLLLGVVNYFKKNREIHSLRTDNDLLNKEIKSLNEKINGTTSNDDKNNDLEQNIKEP